MTDEIRELITLALSGPTTHQECRRCGNFYSLDAAADPTAFCHPCAQTVATMLARHLSAFAGCHVRCGADTSKCVLGEGACAAEAIRCVHGPDAPAIVRSRCPACAAGLVGLDDELDDVYGAASDTEMKERQRLSRERLARAMAPRAARAARGRLLYLMLDAETKATDWAACGACGAPVLVGTLCPHCDHGGK